MRVLIPVYAPPPGSALLGRPAPPPLARRPVLSFLAASRHGLRRPGGRPVLPQRVADPIGRLLLHLVLLWRSSLSSPRQLVWMMDGTDVTERILSEGISGACKATNVVRV